MADIKISAMTGAGALDGTEKVPVIQGGANKAATVDAIAGYIPDFTNLSGTAWDGTNKRVTLTADTAITLSSTRKSGLLRVTGAGFNLTINGTAITLNATGVTLVGFVRDNTDYDFDSNAAATGGGGGGGSYDTDAQTVITAIEGTGVTLTTPQKDAINDRILALKAQSKWTNMKAYYGYVGGTAAAHAINWKSPGTFNITWAGGLTHNANGVTGNGSSGYGDTGINDNAVLTLDDVTIGGYSRTSSATGFLMGVTEGANSLYLADQTGTNGISARLHRGADISTTGTPTRTIIAARQTAAPKEGVYRNGTQLTVSSVAAIAKSNGNIFLLALNNVDAATIQGYSDKCYGSHFIYNGGFSDTEAIQFDTDETAFQTALSRNV
jgi:hypothetical protein